MAPLRGTALRLGSLTFVVFVLAFACSDDGDDAGEGGTSGNGGSAAGGSGQRGGNAGLAADGASDVTTGGSGGTRGGAAGSAGTPAAGSGGRADAMADGRAGASVDGAQPDSARSDAGRLCAERTGGALIRFRIVDETLSVWVTNAAFIDEAKALLASGATRIPNFELVDGQDCDAEWSWHPHPARVSFADFTIELCDGKPSHVEGDKAYWLGTVKSYCPWSAQVTAVSDQR